MWDGNKESTHGGEPTIQRVSVLGSTDQEIVVRILGKNGLEWSLLIADTVSDPTAKHAVKVGNETFTWMGNAELRKK